MTGGEVEPINRRCARSIGPYKRPDSFVNQHNRPLLIRQASIGVET